MAAGDLKGSMDWKAEQIRFRGKAMGALWEHSHGNFEVLRGI
jgi:hypothetical protein